MSGEGRRVIKIRPSSQMSKETEKLVCDIISQGGGGAARNISPIRFVERRSNSSDSMSVDDSLSSSSSPSPSSLSQSSSASDGDANKRHTFSLRPTVSHSQMCEQVAADLRSDRPGTRELALQMVVNLAAQTSNHVFLVFNNAIPSLVDFLTHENEIYRIYASLALSNLAQTESNQPLIAAGDGLTRIVDLLRLTNPEVFSKAISLLINLSGNPELQGSLEELNVLQVAFENPISVSTPDSFLPCVLLVQNILHLDSTRKWLAHLSGLGILLDAGKKFSESNDVQSACSLIVLHLSYHDEYHAKIIEAGSIPMAKRHIHSPDPQLSQSGYHIITNFSSNPSTHDWLWDSGVMVSIIGLTSHDDPDAVEHALICLFNLAIKDVNVEKLVKLGVIPIVASLSRSSTPDIQNRSAKIISFLSANKTARFRLEELHVVPRSSGPDSSAKVSVEEIKALPLQSANASEDEALISHEKHKAHRLHVIMEIMETEKSYVEHLLTVKTFFLDPLTTTHAGLLTDQQIKSIFSTIEIICNLHVMFMQQLEQANSGTPGELFIADPFLNMADSLRLYRTYVSDYDTSIETLSECLDRPKFRKFVEAQEQTFSTLKLSSLLITPIQRIPRYVLLLKDLLKHMTPEHPDYDNLNRALDKILDVADYLDHERAKAESVNKVLAIQEKLVGLQEKLVEPARHFIREGPIITDRSEQGGPSLKCAYLFLFSDLMIECKQRADNRFKVRKMFHLGNVKIVPIDPAIKPNAFHVLPSTEEEKVIFSMSSKQEVEAWTNALHSAIFNFKKSDMQRRVLSENRRMAAAQE